MFKFTHILVFIFLIAPTYSKATNLVTTIQKTKLACSDISDIMHDLRLKAGINTAITGAGTVASGIALGTGLAKEQVEDFLTQETKQILEKYDNNPQDNIIIQDKSAFEQQLAQMELTAIENSISIQDLITLEKTQSDKFGAIRTGTLATATVANITGTAISATNTTQKDLKPQIDKCITAIKELTTAHMIAKLENNATNIELDLASRIIAACRDYETLDLTPIDNRAKSAAIFSGIAAGTGVAGTITSAIAVSKQQEINKNKNLDTASNVMAGTSAAAGATATIFNATQIAAIKKAVAVAEKCEEALK